MAAKVIPLEMSEKRARDIHRAAVQDSAKIIWTDHAKKRMRQRKITPMQVLNCLRSGMIDEPLHRDIEGGWKCTLIRLAAGEEIRVVCSILDGGKLVIVTVM